MGYRDREKQLEAQKRYYYANKDKFRERDRKIRVSKRDFLNQKKSVPCMDCGVEYPPYVMDFDHRPGEEKCFNIASLQNSVTLKVIEEEISKCDIVCANCHRIRTYNRLADSRLTKSHS